MNFRIILLALGTFAIGTDGFMIAGILPHIAHSLSVSPTQVGLLITVFSLTYALGSPILSTWIGNTNRKRMLTLALFIFSLSNFFAALSPNFTDLMLARITAALSAALFTPSAGALAVHLVSENQRGRALSVVTAGLTVAIVLGVPFGTWISNVLFWRSSFAVVGLISLIAAIVIHFNFPVVTISQKTSLSQRLQMAKNPKVIHTLLLTILWTVGGFTVYTYITVLLQHTFQPLENWMALLLFIFGVSSFLGNMLGGYGADRWGPVPTIAISLLLVSTALFALGWLSTFSATIVIQIMVVFSLVIWGIFGWTLTPPQQYRLVQIHPDAAAILLSLNGAAIYFGMALGSGLGGLLIQYLFSDWLGYIGGVFEIIAFFTLMVPIISRRRKYMAKKVASKAN